MSCRRRIEFECYLAQLVCKESGMHVGFLAEMLHCLAHSVPFLLLSVTDCLISPGGAFQSDDNFKIESWGLG